MSHHHVIEFQQVCKSCDGTGVYVGFAEQEGYSVICNTCEGKGWHKTKIEYDDFNGLKRRDKIERVLEFNPGFSVGRVKKLTEKESFEKFGGMSYDEWLEGKPFPPKSEMREYVCPAWWYQTVNYKLKPKWKECCCAGSFDDCKNFTNKNECWQKWDKEFGDN